jgi:hypothetical protein
VNVKETAEYPNVCQGNAPFCILKVSGVRKAKAVREGRPVYPIAFLIFPQPFINFIM